MVCRQSNKFSYKIYICNTKIMHLKISGMFSCLSHYEMKMFIILYIIISAFWYLNERDTEVGGPC